MTLVDQGTQPPTVSELITPSEGVASEKVKELLDMVLVAWISIGSQSCCDFKSSAKRQRPGATRVCCSWALGRDSPRTCVVKQGFAWLCPLLSDGFSVISPLLWCDAHA